VNKPPWAAPRGAGSTAAAYESRSAFAEGDLVVARKTWRGTHRGELLGIPATGKQVTLEVIDISRIRDGKIVEHWSEGGAEREMLEQLGVAAAPEPLRA